MKCIGIIPARYGSVRFPGKPLAMIRGKSMIRRVYEQARSCTLLDDIVVATDDDRIFEHVAGFGKVVMTDNKHPNGTSRCLEAFQIINQEGTYTDQDSLINIQGDEPFIDPGQIEQIAHALKDLKKQIISLRMPLTNKEDSLNPDLVKVVCDVSGKALYFSRSPIPYYSRHGTHIRSDLEVIHYKHVGLYGFRIETLKKITTLPAGQLEIAESLEQLKWMEHGYEIFLEETTQHTIAVDTPEDLENI